jgi:hypothetical protein
METATITLLTALIAIYLQIESRGDWLTFLIIWAYFMVLAVLLKQIKWPWTCKDRAWQ